MDKVEWREGWPRWPAVEYVASYISTVNFQEQKSLRVSPSDFV